ncbi:catalase [Aestuariimicrobium ganziense]|uniref:catalase n=1 Tax=Aestuariimicrobium ganziense TaxID=2773677 RepID=UPI002E286ACE|nr:catalase [Aestuariimicrobium ganziense]
MATTPKPARTKGSQKSPAAKASASKKPTDQQPTDKKPGRKRNDPATPAVADSRPPGATDPDGVDAMPAHDLGQGGEHHQTIEHGGPRMTTAQGQPVSDDQNTLRAGPRGPLLMQDFAAREKLFHFDHERIPERVVHARGYGAHGFFETYESLSDITSAHLFQEKGRRVEAFVRFSTVAGNLGSIDLARDVRGFAVKLYTEEGNWDIVGNNMPVFFIQDAIKFPDLVHAVKEEPDRGFPQAASAHDTFWDFISLMPESTHHVMWLMSDRAIPRSFRFMEGFGVHTFRMVNAERRSHFVKFHWKPKLGLQSVVWNEAVKINGADPDFHRRDLFEAIKSGNPPEWELCLQVFDDEFADSFDFDVLDPTKLIPEEVLPVRKVGRLVLDRVVDNVFAEIEQVAFMTQNVVPGIGFTNDPLLQGRNFSYLDTQLKRLGSTNFSHIPVNAPRCPVAHFQRGGHMQTQVPTGRAAYEPNSWTGDNRGPREDPEQGYRHFPEDAGGQMRQLRPESFADHYSQALMFLRSQTPVEREHMVDAFVFELGKVETPPIRTRMLANLRNVDEAFAQQVADGLGMPLPEASPAAMPTKDVEGSPALSILQRPEASFRGRKLGVLLGDGAPKAVVDALQQAGVDAGAAVALVAKAVGGATLDDGTLLPVDHAVTAAPSVLFDAVAVVGGEKGIAALAVMPEAKDFVRDAFVHQKFIGGVPEAATLLEAAGVTADDGVLPVDDAAGFFTALDALRFWERTP